MGLYLKKEIDNNSVIGIWTITESYDELLNKFRKYVSNEYIKKLVEIKNINRKLEIISTHLLIKTLLNKFYLINHTESGKPFIEAENKNISISHSKKIVSVFISNKDIGIDIEYISNRIKRVCGKFMSQSEIDSIKQNNDSKHIHIYWGAKEALFKLYGKGGIDFRENLIIKPFALNKFGKTEALIDLDDLKTNVDIEYCILKIDNTKNEYKNFIHEYAIVWVKN